MKKKDCDCAAPFKLFCFPSILRNNKERCKWVELLRRESCSKGKWEPATSDRVCSLHFVDVCPSAKNPYPTVNIGYENKNKVKPRRIIKKFPLEKEVEPSEPASSDVDMLPSDNAAMNVDEDVSSTILAEHSYAATSATKPCDSCKSKSNLISSLVGKINAMTLRQKKQSKTAARERAFRPKSNFTWRQIKTDQKMNYYTGISSVLIFNIIFQLIEPFTERICYWRGAKVARSSSKVRRTFLPCSRKVLSCKDEFLLTLMRLRLGLQNEDLADRFGISTTVCSNTSITMIRLLSTVLGGALVVWLPREAIYQHMPDHFKKSGHSKCRVIIDCSEVFIERTKSLYCQSDGVITSTITLSSF